MQRYLEGFPLPSPLQGDTSGCSSGFVEIISKVVYLYEQHILNLNLQTCVLMSTTPGEQPDVSACISRLSYTPPRSLSDPKFTLQP